MGFFKPAWKSKSMSKALNAVDNISDQKTLVEIACAQDIHSSNSRMVKKRALSKITDQQSLLKIGEAVQFDRELMKLVIEKANDQKIKEELMILFNNRHGVKTNSRWLKQTAEEKLESSKRYAAKKQEADKEHYEGGGSSY